MYCLFSLSLCILKCRWNPLWMHYHTLILCLGNTIQVEVSVWAIHCPASTWAEPTVVTSILYIHIRIKLPNIVCFGIYIYLCDTEYSYITLYNILQIHFNWIHCNPWIQAESQRLTLLSLSYLKNTTLFNDYNGFIKNVLLAETLFIS